MSYNYDRIYQNSTSGDRCYVKRRRKRIRNIDFKKLSKEILILALTIGITLTAVTKITSKIIRDNKLDAANDYMRTKIVTYLEESDLDYSVLEDKIILGNDYEKLRDFAKNLKNEGFSEHEIIYMVSQICEGKDFDNIVRVFGYANSKDFLDKNYITGELTSDGRRYLISWGDMKVFENNMEVGYVETVNELMEKEENKGLNR